eukprot:m51a1_g11754 hypothetical protein (580) ;mRNA; f:199862-201652
MLSVHTCTHVKLAVVTCCGAAPRPGGHRGGRHGWYGQGAADAWDWSWWRPHAPRDPWAAPTLISLAGASLAAAGALSGPQPDDDDDYDDGPGGDDDDGDGDGGEPRSAVREAAATALRAAELALIFAPAGVLAPAALAGSLFARACTDAWWGLAYRTLEAAGPVWVKLAQWLATRPDFVPEAACRRLARMQAQCGAHSYGETERALRESLGRTADELFTTLARRPVASGAVAQVHRAVLRGSGRVVAVKVLHPLAGDRVRADLRLIGYASSVLGVAPWLRWASLQDAGDEFCACMRSHLDLRREARNLRTFRRNFRGWRSVKFPVPIRGLVSKSVLVESFEEGELLSRVVGQQPKDAATERLRKDIARVGLSAFLKMVFSDNFIHMDIHPGNVLVRDRRIVREGQQADDSFLWRALSAAAAWARPAQLVLLDAGMVASIHPSLRDNFISLCWAVHSGNAEGAARLMVTHASGGRPARCTPLQADTFCKGMGALFREFESKPLRELPVGKLMLKALSLSSRCHVPIEGKFSSLIVATVVLDGVGRQLDPCVNLLAAAAPHIVYAAAKSALYRLATAGCRQ